MPLTDDFFAELSRLVGEDNISIDDDQRLSNAADASWMARYRIYRNLPLPCPDVVVWPTSSDEVAGILQIASKFGVPVVPRGGGTGIQGGTLAIAGGIGLDLSRMNRILAIEPRSMTVTVEAGVTGPELEEALAPYGLMCAHDPGSFWRGATVGGWVAARGAGITSTKYGKAEDIVVDLEVAIPPGQLITTLPMPSHAVGPGLLSLFVGAEGVFGVITKLTLRLERIPATRTFLTYSFPSVESGMAVCQRIVTSRIPVACMRLYDEVASSHLAGLTECSLDGVVLLVVCEGEPVLTAAEMEAVSSVCDDMQGTSLGDEPCRLWWERRYLPHSEERSPKPPLVYGTADISASFEKLGSIYDERKAALAKRFPNERIRYSAHFSHWYPTGGMIYDRFYVDNPPADAQGVIDLREEIFAILTEIAISHGAVMNDHHGVGRQLHPYMRRQYGNSFDVLERIKNVIDPQGLMNPGKLGFEIA
jgi:alkyldihydroxyacetonephosphate synthase